MKKILKLLLFSITPQLFASTFFTGEAGLSANFINKKSFGIDPALAFSGFLGGQLALSNSLSLQGEFAVQTSDLYENGFSKEALSIFRINEISATYTKSFADATHTFTLFKGYNESIGTQKFLTRRLYVDNYSSILTENYLGQNGITAYELFGTGGSYSVTLKNHPVCLGLVISRNNENTEDVSQLNCDLRFATSNKYISLDFLSGLGAPLYTKNGDEDVVLLIDTIYLHTGFDFLLGNKYSTSALYLQGGFEYLPVKKTDKAKEFKTKDIFFLVEPRFKFGGARLFITVFNIPDGKVNTSGIIPLYKSLLIEDPFGINFAMFAETMYKKHRNYSAGMHLMASFEGKQFTDYSDNDFSDCLNLKFCPFTEFEADGGKVCVIFQANVMKFADSKPGAFTLHIGYKKDF